MIRARWESTAAACIGASLAAVAHADLAPGTTEGIIAGTAAANAAKAPSARPSAHGRLTGSAFSDWIDPATGSPGFLGAGCGVAVEVAVSGTGSKNYVNVDVANTSDTQIDFFPDETTMRFSSGLTRRPKTTGGGGGITLDPSWMVRGAMELPDKADFKGPNWILVQIVTVSSQGGRCTVPVLVERDESQSADPSAYLVHTTWEVAFDGGSGFARTGSLRSVVEPKGFTMGFGVVYYPWVHHGFTLDVVVSRYGTDGVAAVVPARSPEGLEITGAGFLLGYAARLYPLSWLSVGWQPSVGPYVFGLSEARTNGETILQRGVFAVQNRLRLSARFATISDGTQLSFIASAVQLWVPHGTFGDASVSGNAFSALVGIACGL
jgi:hypothetical protein